MVYLVFGVVYGVSIVGVYLATRKKYATVQLNDVNELLSDILEVNFKNNSLSNAAQSILIVLKRFYTADYVTILTYNERAKKMSVIASNVTPNHLKYVEEYCNTSLKNMNRFASKVSQSDNGFLSYPTATDRGVVFSSFTPLSYDNHTIGGILIENKQSANASDGVFRQSLYQKVFKSTALVLQNVIYTEALIAMTSTDQLTGVHNRRFIDMTLGEQLNIHRNLGMSLSVALFDIDHFKKFNDTYGHPFGDIVLQEVAKYMDDNMGTDEWVARYGGEEFVLFFGRSTEQEVYQKVERLRDGLSRLVISNGDTDVSVTASFGVATYPSFGDSSSDLIELADRALYESKRQGRNRVTVYAGQASA